VKCSSHSYDAAEVKQAIGPKLDVIIKDIFPEARKDGREFRIGSLSGDKGTSMSISTDPSKMGAWIDHNGDGSGDLFDILKETKGLNYGQAVTYLAEQYTQCSKQEYGIKTPLKVQKTFKIEEHTNPLTPEVIGYEESIRMISPATLEVYGIQVANNDPSAIAFPCFNDNGDCTRISFVNVNDKATFRCTPGSSNNLFGKPAVDPNKTNGVVVVTEGQQDAMSWYEAGFPAVSMPSGIGNLKWIEDDWSWLKQFHTIILSMDMDEKGQEGLQKAAQRLQINRCKVLDLPLKDASDMLQEGRMAELPEIFKRAKFIQPEEIVSAQSKRDAVFDRLNTDLLMIGDPYFLQTLQYRERVHEGTLVYGITGHGKSNAVDCQVAFNASNNIPTMVYTPEMISEAILGHMVLQIAGEKHEMVSNDRKAFNLLYETYITPNIYLYDSSKKCSPKKLISIFTYAYKRFGIEKFIVDNVMTLDIDIDSVKEQAKAANMFREFWVEYPVHVTMVAHPRKPPTGSYFKEPELSEVRGASEWGDMASNVLCVWRNKEKERTQRDMIDQGVPQQTLNIEFKDVEDGRIVIKKQRETGIEHAAKTWFDGPSKRLMYMETTPAPWYSLDELRAAGKRLKSQ
tara:strand:- start:2910 stop:4787 length:1878 start_codon:yes stop_codon:yes gene_type:complete